jgi:hypothetical protein
MGSHGRWDDCDIIFMITMIVKQRKFKCIECKGVREGIESWWSQGFGLDELDA